MPSDKRIFVNPNGGAWKGGMDKDSEIHYVQNGYYRDARNISFMVNGDRFTVKNLKGNTSKSYTLNSGANVCIGAFDDKGNETVYYFIWNGDDNHEILKYEYNSSVDTISQLVEGVGLAFDVDKLITGITIVNDRFLVWGQQDQEVGCIDLEDVPVATITASNRWRVELAKIEDPEPLECFYLEDQSRSQNALTKRTYQFRYRYIYEGGFRSPFSTISKAPIPDNIFLKGDDEDESYYDNAINLSLPQPSFDKVTKIELFVRYATTDATKEAELWYKFKTVDYDKFNASQSSLDVVFTGNEALLPADPAETLTETSFFPKSVKEVVFLPSNVLSFLNFKEGNDSSSVVPKVQIIPQYNTRPTAKGTATTTASYNNTSNADVLTLYNVNYNIDLTTTAYETVLIGGTPRVGDTVQISLVLNYQEQSLLTNPANIPASPSTVSQTFTIRYVVKESDTTTAIIARKVASVINSIDTRFDNFGGIVARQVGAVIRIYEGDNQNNTPYDVRTTINSASTTASVTVDYPTATTNLQWEIQRTKNTLKRNARHPFAIQYKDEKGRRSDAIPIGDVFIKGQDETSADDWVELKIVIGHLAPSWATHYDILYAKNQTFEEFVQVACNVDVIEEPDFPFLGPDDVCRARIYDQFRAVYDVYSDGNSTLDSYNFTYAEGDRIRLLGVIGDGYTGLGEDDEITFFSEQVDLNLTADDSKGVLFKYDLSSLTPSLSIRDTVLGGYDFTPVTGGSPNVGGDISRTDGGSFITDGFVPNQRIVITEASNSANNLETTIVGVSASTLSVTAVLATDTADILARITRTNKMLVEVYTPKTQSTRLYYEIAAQGTVDSNGYHSGNTQDQTASLAAILDLDDIGDAYQVSLPSLTKPAAVDIDETQGFIECEHMSPLKVSSVTSIGRGNVELDSDTEIERDTAITYTQPIIEDSNSNGLSIVLPTSIYNDFGSDFGSIQKSFLRQDRQLVIFFEDKVGTMGVFSELRKAPDGTVSYATQSLTNQLNLYAYDGGIGINPESFSYYDTTCYFLSARNNAVCRLANDGITEISNYGMQSWFNENLDVKTNNLQGIQTPATYDERNGSYILNIKNRFSLTYVSPSGEGNAVIATPNVEGNYGESLIQVGDTIIITDTSGNSYSAEISAVSYDSGTGQFTITYGASPPNDEIFTLYIISNVETLHFSEDANAWLSFLDFTPDYMTTCGVDFVSFNNGSLWVHNTNSTYSSFYGTGVTAEVTVPFNIEPSAMKVFMNIEQETNDAWISETDGDVSTPAGQTSQIFDEWYTQLQPYQFSAWIGKDTSTPTALVPTNKVFEGFELRDTALTIRLTQDLSTESKLRSVTVNSSNSPLSY